MMFSLTAQEKRVNDYIDSLERENKGLNSEVKSQSKEIAKQQDAHIEKESHIKFLKHQLDRSKDFISKVPEDVVREIKNNSKSKSRQR